MLHVGRLRKALCLLRPQSLCIVFIVARACVRRSELHRILRNGSSWPAFLEGKAARVVLFPVGFCYCLRENVWQVRLDMGGHLKKHSVSPHSGSALGLGDNSRLSTAMPDGEALVTGKQTSSACAPVERACGGRCGWT